MAGGRVTVVGAGVVGLSCAVRIAEAGHPVDVLARELPLETTSAVAGGLWLPFLADPPDLVARWSRATHAEFLNLAGEATGVAVRTGYLLGIGTAAPPWAAGIDLDLHPVTHPAPGQAEGLQVRAPLVDMTRYLPYLVKRLEAAGGTLTRLPVTALPTRGIVVNCTGLAARALAADPLVRPVRGQVVWMTNPGLTNWWSVETDPLTYVLPHPGRVVVGGTTDDGEFDTTPDDETARRMVERARALVPALEKADVLSTRVGLRPARPAVRLETVPGAEGTTIHCYGHGGSGVTLSWGSADDVLAAVEHVLEVTRQ
jgi:D-amino-acid oxidase